MHAKKSFPLSVKAVQSVLNVPLGELGPIASTLSQWQPSGDKLDKQPLHPVSGQSEATVELRITGTVTLILLLGAKGRPNAIAKLGVSESSVQVLAMGTS